MSPPSPADPSRQWTGGGAAQLLDNTWLLTLAAVLLATQATRLLSAFDVDAAAIGWGVLGLGVIHVALAAAASAERSQPPWLPAVLVSSHAAGVLLIGAVWQCAGGLQNPSFLLAFVLPVIGATFISRRLPYLTAALAVVVVSTLALRHSPELRWYVDGLGPRGAWLAALAGRAAGAGSSLPGFYAPAGYFAVTLVGFAILLSGCAVSAEFLASLVARFQRQTQSAQRELALAQDLCSAFIRELPLPAALIDPDTLEVVEASRDWKSVFGQHETSGGTGLLDLVKFSYPEMVEELIAGEGGSARPCMLRLGGQLRATEIRVQRLERSERPLALLIVQDVTESLCVSAALDAADTATLILDSEARVIAFNTPARGLLTEREDGADVSELLSQIGGRGGWQPGLSGRRKSQARIRGRHYEVRTWSIALPGEAECIYVLAVAPLARATAESRVLGALSPT